MAIGLMMAGCDTADEDVGMADEQNEIGDDERDTLLERPMDEDSDLDTGRREVSLQLKVPSAGWGLDIEEAYQLNDEIWVVSRLQAPEGMAAQVISTVGDSVVFYSPPDVEVKHFVIGKTWDWENEAENVRFIDSRGVIGGDLEDARQLYPPQTAEF